MAIDRVMHLVKQRDANLSPAINRTWTDYWGRAEVISIYQIVLPFGMLRVGVACALRLRTGSANESGQMSGD